MESLPCLLLQAPRKFLLRACAGLQRKVEVKGALRADDADILSAYSTEQGDESNPEGCLGRTLATCQGYAADLGAARLAPKPLEVDMQGSGKQPRTS